MQFTFNSILGEIFATSYFFLTIWFLVVTFILGWNIFYQLLILSYSIFGSNNCW